MSSPIIGYWSIRGLVLPYAGSQLAYSGVKYETVAYNPGVNYSNAEWLKVSTQNQQGFEFPNLPYLIDGPFKLTESLVIHMYAADKWNPELLGKDPVERARVNMVSSVIKDFKIIVTRPADYQVRDAKLMAIIDQELPKITKFMAGNKFLVGDRVTWVDFYFWEFLQVIKYIHPEVLDSHKNLVNYDQ